MHKRIVGVCSARLAALNAEAELVYCRHALSVSDAVQTILRGISASGNRPEDAASIFRALEALRRLR